MVSDTNLDKLVSDTISSHHFPTWHGNCRMARYIHPEKKK